MICIKYLSVVRSIYLPFVLTLVILISMHSVSICQTDQRAQVVQRLQDLANVYRKANHLSFNITYRYSSEAKPLNFLDSLAGNFKLNGSSFWYGIDNSEFFGNDTINIAIFNEDKVIYINGKSVVNQSANPLAMIDSVLLNNQYSTVSLATAALTDDLVINFQPGFQFKKIEYLIDSKTGFIKRMIAVIHTEEMYDPAVKPLLDKTKEFGILDVAFTNYQPGSFTDLSLSPDKFIMKMNGNYQGTGIYSAYQIYNGATKQ